MLFEEGDVGFAVGFVLEELFVGRLEHGGSLDVWQLRAGGQFVVRSSRYRYGVWPKHSKPGWRRKRTFADPLHGAHFSAILHAVNGEVDFGEGLLLLYCANSIVDLNVAKVLGTRRPGAVGIHGERRKIGEIRQRKGNTRRGGSEELKWGRRWCRAWKVECAESRIVSAPMVF